MTVLDSNGYVLFAHCVPNAKVEYQLRMLKYIVERQEKTIQDGKREQGVVNAISIDNASQYGPSLKDNYMFWRQQPLTVLQDLYHASVTRELVSNHQLKFQATNDIKKILGSITTGDDVTKQEFINQMKEYIEQYSKPQAYSAIGDMSKISRIGAHYNNTNDTILTPEQLVEQYSRNNPNDVDISNKVTNPVLHEY